MASTSGRCATSSDEEERNSVGLSESSKRSRRRRGRRTRKKSDRDSPASEGAADSPLQSRKRTCSLGAPPAPRNTNDFLIEDMEKREEDGAKRLRREQDEVASSLVEPREESDEGLTGEDEFEDQYEESWQECVVDKYKEMNHDELARRMAAMEKNRDEVERKLRWERSKSDYLQERLLEAEEQIRRDQDCPGSGGSGGSGPGSGTDSPPPPPVPASCVSGGMMLGPNCSPNVISSPRA